MQGKSLAWTLEHTKHSTNKSHVIIIHIFVIISIINVALGLLVWTWFQCLRFLVIQATRWKRETLETSAILGGRTGGGLTVGFHIINAGDQNPSSTLS